MNARERIQDYYDKLTQNYNELIAIADSLPEEISSIAKPETVFFRGLEIEIPYDISSLRKTRKLLKGWKFKEVWGGTRPSHTYRNFLYQHPDFNLPITLSMDLSEEGSTCRIEKVGEETKEVYKVICN